MSRSVYLMDGPKSGQTVQVADDASELVVVVPMPSSDFLPNGSIIKPTDPDVLGRVYYKSSGKVSVTYEGSTLVDRQELWTCQGDQL